MASGNWEHTFITLPSCHFWKYRKVPVPWKWYCIFPTRNLWFHYDLGHSLLSISGSFSAVSLGITCSSRFSLDAHLWRLLLVWCRGSPYLHKYRRRSNILEVTWKENTQCTLLKLTFYNWKLIVYYPFQKEIISIKILKIKCLHKWEKLGRIYNASQHILTNIEYTIFEFWG